MFKTISASALIAAMATASFAGSLNDATVEPTPSDDGVFVPAVGSGIGAPVIVGAVVAAAAVAAIAADDDDDTPTTTTDD